MIQLAERVWLPRGALSNVYGISADAPPADEMLLVATGHHDGARGALPAIIALVMVSSRVAPTVEVFETVVLGAMLCGAIAPLVVLAIAAPAFANELEDRTLANLTIAPLPRWHIVAAKLMAVLTMSAPFVVASALVTSWIAFLGDPRAIMAVTVGALAGVTLYSSAFVLLGLMTTQAIGIGLLYVVVWEGFSRASWPVLGCSASGTHP